MEPIDAPVVGEIVHPDVGTFWGRSRAEPMVIHADIGRLKRMWEVALSDGNDQNGHPCEHCGMTLVHDRTHDIKTCCLCLQRFHDNCGAYVASIRIDGLDEVDVTTYCALEIHALFKHVSYMHSPSLRTH